MTLRAGPRSGTLAQSALPLPLVRRGKVREVYAVDPEHLLLVASDRISAFDVVMRETIPHKGAVLTQLSAFWFARLRSATSHFVTASADEIVARVPALGSCRDQLVGRATLARRAEPIPFECVVRGYLAGSAWQEYQESGTLAGEGLPRGMMESDPLDPPLFSPATKAESGHDENIAYARMVAELGTEAATRLRDLSIGLYLGARTYAAERGIIIADTKFEFGRAAGDLILIDEVLTPDSSRFWPSDRYQPGGPQPSFDKQPLRDYLADLRRAGRWNGDAPPPPLPPDVVEATSLRYLEAFRLITGHALRPADGGPA